MEPWVLSDGTEVRLGGVVTGDSVLARKLREDVAYLADGGAVLVPLRAPPSGSEPLKLESPPLVDAWVRNIATRYKEGLQSAPMFAPIPSPPPSDADPEVVY